MIDLLNQIGRVSLLVFFVSSLLAMGLALTPRAILAPLRNGRLVLLALGLKLVFAPALAWLLTTVIPLERGHAIGLLLLGGAAGAPFLPNVVAAARGDFALAIGLMGLLTLGTIFFLPFALPLMIPGLQADPWAIARPLLLLIVLPLAIGMFVKSLTATFAARVAPMVGKLSTVSVLLAFVMIIVVNFRGMLGVLGSGAILASLLFTAGLFIAGWLLGGAKPEVGGVLGLATAVRNFGAALVSGTSSFNDPSVTIMILVSVIVCLTFAFFAVRWVRRRAKSVPSEGLSYSQL